MSFNVAGAVEVPLSVFGGLVSEMSPTTLPEGVSPSCNDCVFLPGNVSSRPGMQRVFATPIGPVAVAYGKSYVDPAGTIFNLYLDSAGNIWGENITVAAGTLGLIATTTPGSYAKSITAFGREYIAISDGMHGTEVPLQYDGVNLDRVTQDGPGSAPNVTNLSLPSVAMLAASGDTIPVVEIDPTNPSGGFYTTANMYVPAPAFGVQIGTTVVVSGNSSAALNGTWNVTNIFPGTPNYLVVISLSGVPDTTPYGLGGIATLPGAAISRQNNLVTVQTASAHGLKPGNQAQITGVPALAIGAGISSITIDNAALPGIATVTTNDPHGLAPEAFVSITGVPGATVGGSISAISRQGEVVSVTTASAHGLAPGAVVTLAGVTDTSFNTIATVLTVASSTTFTFPQVNTTSATSSGGTVSANWPVPDTATPNYFQVVSAPTSTSFQVEINYGNGTWSGGVVSFAWDGIYFVLSVPSATVFTYTQYGPNGIGATPGAVTPYGQVAPGQHQMSVMFLTRQGYITRPSPPVKIEANGGQYLSVSNIPIGPGNVVARILAFTGADGAYFFYIPTTPQVNGQVVGTSTQINDNTTTSVVLDFSDNTLYASMAISTEGNDLASQIVIDGALGFGFDGTRLITYGQRNRIQNLLNLTFDGGYFPSAAPQPTGWTVNDPHGQLVTGRYGFAWQINVAPSGARGGLYQYMYQDAYGAPIATGNTLYKIRVWLKPGVVASDLTFFAQMQSLSASYFATATVPGSAMNVNGGWAEATFSSATPTTIPSDLTFAIYAESTSTTTTLLVDEISVIYDANPYLDTILYGSYVNNPEAFDGVTGKFGPVKDTRKVMDLGIVRDTLYLLTQEPSGRIHGVTNNGVTEPAGWGVNEIGANCGAVSAFCTVHSQADDASTGGGEEWFAWASASGARIFGGDQPFKISQEIQPDWTGDVARGIQGINPAAWKTVWALNDPDDRSLYFGLPRGTATTPNFIYYVSYRQLETAYQIAISGPVHTSFSGRLVATDNVRKWCPWNLSMAGAARLYRQAGGDIVKVFFGSAPYGNIYSLNATKLTDDDFGVIQPSYTTASFLAHDAEIALQLGSHRKSVQYVMAFVSGTGVLTITILCDTLTNPWPLTGVRTLSQNPQYDLEWTGGSASAQRFFFKFSTAPATGTDNSFSIQKFVAALKQESHLPVRGAA